MRLTRGAVAASLVTALVMGQVAPVGAQAIPVPPTADDPVLRGHLDAVVGASPPDTCLSVSVDGTSVYSHDPGLASPASIQKLLTAATALQVVGASKTYDTVAVSTGKVNRGVLEGDLVLIGAGDPGLVTSLSKALLRTPDDRPVTLLDGIAEQISAKGITKIDGRVLVDESHYDNLRVVPNWPDRHARANVAGPLSAAAVDDGYLMGLDGDGDLRVFRSPDPPLDTARTLRALLDAHGVSVAGEPGAAEAPEGARELAKVSSAPLADIVSDMLERSDNTTAELVLKEIGAVARGNGSTTGGAAQVAALLNGDKAAPKGAVVSDGSGLDLGNQLTCGEVVTVLDQHRELRPLLAVAGVSGTLRDRFTMTDAVGVLAGKTGSLNSVTSLAGYVALPDGGTATFAFIVNDATYSSDLVRTQDLLAQLLATYEPPCSQGPVPPIIDPVLAQLAQLAPLTGLEALVTMPTVAGLTVALEARSQDLIDRCSVEGGAVVVLAPPVRAN